MRAPGRSTSRQFPVHCSWKSVPNFKRQTFVPTVVKFHHIFQCAELPFSWWMLCASRPCFFATLQRHFYGFWLFSQASLLSVWFYQSWFYQSWFSGRPELHRRFNTGPAIRSTSTKNAGSVRIRSALRFASTCSALDIPINVEQIYG